jgi:hypothetical protein
MAAWVTCEDCGQWSVRVDPVVLGPHVYCAGDASHPGWESHAPQGERQVGDGDCMLGLGADQCTRRTRDSLANVRETPELIGGGNRSALAHPAGDTPGVSRSMTMHPDIHTCSRGASMHYLGGKKGACHGGYVA